MLLAAETISAAHAALENAEKVFDVVRGVAALVHVATSGVPNALVVAELAADLFVERAVIGNENGLAIRVCEKNVADLFGGRGLDVKGAGVAVRLD